jgi:tetratricopeptide (TPR) repeat protein
MRVLLHLLLIGLVMLAIGQDRALAQPAPTADKTKVAKQYVDAGLAAQGTGDYDTALTMYSKAYQLVPHPLLIFNMAQAHRLAGHIDQALTLYARYLSEDPNGAQAKTARELVAELKAHKARTTTDKAGDEDQPGSGAKRVARPPRNEPSRWLDRRDVGREGQEPERRCARRRRGDDRRGAQGQARRRKAHRGGSRRRPSYGRDRSRWLPAI